MNQNIVSLAIIWKLMISAGLAAENVHPRLFVSESHLECVKVWIKKKRSPWWDSYSRIKESHKNTQYVPPYLGSDDSDFFSKANAAGDRARDLALLFWLGGERNFAGQAKAQILGWAQSQPLPGANLTFKLSTGMKIARGIGSMLYAYDLLCDRIGWLDQERSDIKAWLMELLRVVKKSINHWEESNYNDGHYYQNHLVAHTFAFVAVGALLGDKELFNFGLNSNENPRNAIKLISGMILQPGDEVDRTDPGRSNIMSGEIVDRYRHYEKKGLQYAHLSLLLLTSIGEILSRNQFDYFGYISPSGEHLRHSFEFYSDFYRTGDANVRNGFYSGESDRIGRVGDGPVLFEIGLSQYRDSIELLGLVLSKDRRAYQNLWIFGDAVLTHGIDLEQ